MTTAIAHDPTAANPTPEVKSAPEANPAPSANPSKPAPRGKGKSAPTLVPDPVVEGRIALATAEAAGRSVLVTGWAEVAKGLTPARETPADRAIREKFEGLILGRVPAEAPTADRLASAARRAVAKLDDDATALGCDVETEDHQRAQVQAAGLAVARAKLTAVKSAARHAAGTVGLRYLASIGRAKG